VIKYDKKKTALVDDPSDLINTRRQSTRVIRILAGIPNKIMHFSAVVFLPLHIIMMLGVMLI
jgi:uncharacterized transporter YbjL